MTKLLVSVRDAAEAVVAAGAGADLIDVKEPSRGPLGAADVSTIEDVLQAVAGRRPVSAAFGELPDWRDVAPKIPHGLSYAKFGLAGCAQLADWATLWRRQLAALPADVERVAVAYADWQVARAPDPYSVVAHATEIGCGAVLLDTFDKRGRSLVEILSRPELQRFLAYVRARRLLMVVGGGLSATTLQKILPFAPDYVAVRGAVCSGGRAGALDPEKVRALVRLLVRSNHGSRALRAFGLMRTP
jgi:uncharacterized protein (UPF0264 family)